MTNDNPNEDSDAAQLYRRFQDAINKDEPLKSVYRGNTGVGRSWNANLQPLHGFIETDGDVDE